MSLEEKIMPDLKTAMKNKDQAALRSIRAIKAAILLMKTDGSGKEINEASEIKLLQKLVKQRQDSFDIFNKQGRQDLADIEKSEIEVIKKYLPKQLDKEQLTVIVQTTIAETGANGMKDMGKVMGMVNKKVAGQADGKTIAMLVKDLLNKN